MKKLMMAAAIVCAAAGIQAAQVTWGSVDEELYDGTGTGTLVADGLDAYVILGAYSQADFAAAYSASDGDKDATLTAAGANKVAEGATDSGYVFGDDFTADTGVNAYMVVFDTDKVYISALYGIEGDPLDPSVGTFDILATTGSDVAPLSGAYSGAGWYTAGEPVPEPTSGLLVLLGMAGLALRRRRA